MELLIDRKKSLAGRDRAGRGIHDVWRTGGGDEDALVDLAGAGESFLDLARIHTSRESRKNQSYTKETVDTTGFTPSCRSGKLEACRMSWVCCACGRAAHSRDRLLNQPAAGVGERQGLSSSFVRSVAWTFPSIEMSWNPPNHILRQRLHLFTREDELLLI